MLMRNIFAIITGLLLVTSAHAQSVQQSGSITPNHVPRWVSNGVIGDGGTAADSPITSFGVTSNTTAGFCVSSGRSTASGRQQLCLGAPLASNAVISLQNYGTAPAKGLDFIINGVTASLPSGGGDFVTGIGPYGAGHVPCFVNTTSEIQDCGLTLFSGTVTAGNWAGTPIPLTFGGTGGTSAATARTNLGLGTMATQDASAVAIAGGTITGMPSPTSATDVAIKSYVDSLASGLTILASSALATAAVLPNTPTYANGASGVGATLTAGSNTTLTVDGTAAPLNTVVLVKNQASAFQNGIYTVTTAGGGVPWVLTRATYFDQAAEMKAGSYTLITGGVTNINSSYTLQTAVTTVGTDALTWVQFATGTAGTVTNIATTYPMSGGTITTTGTLTSVAPTTSGQLTYTSTTALTFKPYNGDTLKISGVIFQIPSAGIAGCGDPTSVFLEGVAAQTLGVNSTYYIYAFSNSGTVTCDFSVTGHSPSTTAGNIGTEIKTGSDTRSLIGLVRTGATVIYASDLQTASWFNRRDKSSQQTQNIASGAATIAINFVTWAEESFSISFYGTASETTLNANSSIQNTVDAVNVGSGVTATNPVASGAVSLSAGRPMTSTEGAHIFYTIYSVNVGIGALLGESWVQIRG